MGDQALELLGAGGVDLSEVKRLDVAQGVAMIFVDEAGENVIGILPGANDHLTIEDAERTLAGLGSNDVLVVQQEIQPGSTIRALSVARERGARPAPGWRPCRRRQWRSSSREPSRRAWGCGSPCR
jgi:ribokinase